MCVSARFGNTGIHMQAPCSSFPGLALAVFLSMIGWDMNAACGGNGFEPGSIDIMVEGKTRTYPYQLHRPAGLAKDEQAPLVVFLHGAGERGRNNTDQLRHFPERFVREKHLTRHDAYLLAVQCPKKEAWVNIDKRWEGEPDFQNPSPAILAVAEAIRKIVKDERIDTSRIYLTGLSMGGFGSWDLAARHPEWFAAVVPICGGGAAATADRLTGLPIWAFHGSSDEVVPERQSRVMIEAIRSKGGRPAYTVLPGVRHDSWHHAYGPEGAMSWMFSQVRPGPKPDFSDARGGEDSGN